MKPEYKEVIIKAMPLIISSLEVDVSFLSVFEANGIFTEHSIQEIQVNLNKAVHAFGMEGNQQVANKNAHIQLKLVYLH